MKLKVFSIYDSKAETFAHPNFILNRGTFMRALLENLSDPQSNLAKYPADFTAFEIGEWDDSTGTLELYPAKVNIGCLIEFQAPLMKQTQSVSQPLNSFQPQPKDH